MEKAFAKVNLHLAVLHKRADSYHNIQSLMCSLDFFDTLEVEELSKKKKKGSELFLKVEGPYKESCEAIPLESNTIYKAFVLFFENVNFDVKLKLKLIKRIPSGAGLGGGSADAAALLRMLNRSFKIYSNKQLSRIAVKVGADVPYCLDTRLALCEGIGERISRLPFDKKYYAVLVNSGIHVSTREAYAGVRLEGLSAKKSKAEFVSSLKSDNFSSFYNSFEEVVLSKHAKLREIKQQLLDNAATFAIMTGSGSSIIGLYKDKRKCIDCCTKMKRSGFDVVMTSSK